GLARHPGSGLGGGPLLSRSRRGEHGAVRGRTTPRVDRLLCPGGSVGGGAVPLPARTALPGREPNRGRGHRRLRSVGIGTLNARPPGRREPILGRFPRPSRRSCSRERDAGSRTPQPPSSGPVSTSSVPPASTGNLG